MMLEKLKGNIESLIAAYEAAKVENTRLKKELQDMTDQNRTYREQNTELEIEIDNLKLAQAFLSTSDDSGQAKARIEKLIRSIDRCIALMEK